MHSVTHINTLDTKMWIRRETLFCVLNSGGNNVVCDCVCERRDE